MKRRSRRPARRRARGEWSPRPVGGILGWVLERRTPSEGRHEDDAPNRSPSRAAVVPDRPGPALPVAAACAGLLASAMAAGQARPRSGRRAAPTGKPVLFDGKTLDGWKKTDFFHAGEVKVEDGRIVLAAGELDDRHHHHAPGPAHDGLRADLRGDAARAGTTSSPRRPSPWASRTSRWSTAAGAATSTGLSSLDGMDASENETTRSIKYEDRTWYRFRVRVTGEVIRCWVGDKEVIAVNHKEKHVGTRVETGANEPLGFATWKTAGALRNIEVRALTPDEIAATNKIDDPRPRSPIPSGLPDPPPAQRAGDRRGACGAASGASPVPAGYPSPSWWRHDLLRLGRIGLA